ncbi:MAG TPA: patatin-like phospholipase family protein [Thermoanaerobaculaceae bacterium]|nr:patatin-like phospholipase family protein [Thermoanaerobaculaceae bacterium]
MGGPLNVFCASGGGSKGAFEGGVLQALCEAGIELHGFVGVSTGSIQAGFMSQAAPGIEAQREQLGRLRDLWFGLEGNSSIYAKPAFGIVGTLARVLLGKPSLYTFAPFRELLANGVTSGPQRPVRIGIVELGSSRYVVADPRTPADLRAAILASCSIPGFFPPVHPDLVDGGVRNIAPLATAFKLASELLRGSGEWDRVDMYVALASPRAVEPDQRTWTAQSLPQIALRALEILEGENYGWDIEGALEMNSIVEFFDSHPGYERPRVLTGKLRADVRLFEPKATPYSALDFEPAKIRSFWEAGYQEARAVLARGSAGVLALAR